MSLQRGAWISGLGLRAQVELRRSEVTIPLRQRLRQVLDKCGDVLPLITVSAGKGAVQRRKRAEETILLSECDGRENQQQNEQGGAPGHGHPELPILNQCGLHSVRSLDGGNGRRRHELEYLAHALGLCRSARDSAGKGGCPLNRL